MIAYFVADIAYLGIVLCDLGALLLALEWLTHFLPGETLNPLRRVLFRITFPFLKFGDQFFPTKWGKFNSRGLIMAVFLIVISRYGMPWLVLLSFSMRG
jgi:uncharacterized protein YggT (Ycf19 family)